MLKQTPKKRVLFVRRFTPVALAVFGVFSFVLLNVRATPVAHADDVYNKTVNFQARLQTAAGAVVPDATYNVQFKMYDVSSGGSAIWSETYQVSAGKGLNTVNGYLSTSLGSVTPFQDGIQWSHRLWITMNIGGTASTPIWDGEMDPRMEMTAVPYAFRAGQLVNGNTDGSLVSTLSIQAPTGGTQNFVIQDQGLSGTYNLLTENQANAKYIKLQANGNVVTQSGNISITGDGTFSGSITTNGNIVSNAGSLELKGTNQTNYITPLGISIASKINIANFDPGAYGQIVAFGLPSSAGSTSRVLTVLDARSSVHQPSVAVLSPGESQIFGLSWDGSNSTPVLKTTTNDIALQAGGLNVLTASNASGNSVITIGTSGSSSGKLQLSNATNSNTVTVQATSVSSSYTIQLPGVTGTAGQCMVLASVVSGVQTLGYSNCSSTLQDAYNNSGGSPTINLNTTGHGLSIQDASTTVGGKLFAVQNNGASTDYLAVTTTGTTIGGDLSASGAVLFKNASDSTSAFRVQNAASQSIFVVDTAGSQVRIGPSGGTAGGTLLVLGSRTDPGDPTAVDGAMYYNATANTFRCAESGVWVSCIGGILRSDTAIASTIANTTTETAFNKTYTVPQQYCAQGRVLRVSGYGLFSATSGDTLTVRVKLGSTTIATTQATAFSSTWTAQGWTTSFNIICPAVYGTGKTVTTQGVFTFAGDKNQQLPYATSTIDTDTNQDLTITVQWSAASTGNSITLQSFVLEGLGGGAGS